MFSRGNRTISLLHWASHPMQLYKISLKKIQRLIIVKYNCGLIYKINKYQNIEPIANLILV